MKGGHAKLDTTVRYTDTKAECRQVDVSCSDGAYTFLPLLPYRLDNGVHGVNSDWRR